MCPSEKTIKRPLVVDLDHTLVKTDLLFEGLWSVFRESPLQFFSLLVSLRRGKAFFKQKVAEASQLNLSEIPFNDVVIDYIHQWKQRGDSVLLVTAADQSIADKVGEHLDVFDEIHGSNGNKNLKASEKAKFLCKLYGSKGFAYVGDSNSDFKVWEHASQVIAVRASKAQKKRLKKRFGQVEYLDGESRLKSIIQLIRPKQWLKNTLVFLPVLAAKNFGLEAVMQSALAFVAFSFAASAVYTLNDLFDVKNDRNSPLKKHRPIAAGNVKITSAIGVGLCLFGFGLTIAFLIQWQLFLVIGLYVLLNLFYSAYLKRVVIIDICFLSVFYLLRVYAGSVATDIDLSFWLLAFSLFLFFSLGAIKRMNELVLTARKSMPGRGYNITDLSIISQISVASSFSSSVLLALYLNSANVTDSYTSPSLLWGLVLILVFWLNRLILLTNRGDSKEPLLFFLQDKVSYSCAFLAALLIWSASI
jgi:4-hydroxybenzoate polyprenyltransferase